MLCVIWTELRWLLQLQLLLMINSMYKFLKSLVEYFGYINLHLTFSISFSLCLSFLFYFIFLDFLGNLLVFKSINTIPQSWEFDPIWFLTFFVRQEIFIILVLDGVLGNKIWEMPTRSGTLAFWIHTELQWLCLFI